MRSIARFLPSAVLLAATLSLAAVAAAGGHATIKATALPPGITANKGFPLEFAVLHNGTTPMKDLEPTVVATQGSRKLTTRARWDAARSRYVAKVRLPESGAWRLAIESNFCGNRLVLDPVKVGPTSLATR